MKFYLAVALLFHALRNKLSTCKRMLAQERLLGRNRTMVAHGIWVPWSTLRLREPDEDKIDMNAMWYVPHD